MRGGGAVFTAKRVYTPTPPTPRQKDARARAGAYARELRRQLHTTRRGRPHGRAWQGGQAGSQLYMCKAGKGGELWKELSMVSMVSPEDVRTIGKYQTPSPCYIRRSFRATRLWGICLYSSVPILFSPAFCNCQSLFYNPVDPFE